MPLQRKNAEAIDLFGTYFFKRNEPNVAWTNAVSAINMLPVLRGSWPMSAVSGAGGAIDVSGNGRVLTNNSLCQFKNIDLVPCVDIVAASTQYLSRPTEPGLDIIGNETYILSTLRGLTMGGWFQFDSVPASTYGLMSKWLVAGALRAYRLVKDSNNKIVFSVSDDGTNVFSATSTTAVTAGPWFFCAGRFDPTSELKVWLNDETDTTVIAIPTLKSSSQAFEIGRTNATNYLNGEASLCWLCASYLEDYIVDQVFEQTRSLFGV